MELKEELFLPGVEQDELEMVLFSYFGRGSSASGGRSTYQKEENDNEFSLTIIYNQKGIIESMKAGGKLNQNNIKEIKQKIINDLLNSQNEMVGRAICFSESKKFDKCFVYKNKFQLLPMPFDTPQIEHNIRGYYPILLEYKYISSKNIQVNNLRKDRRINELIYLIHLLTNGKFYGPSRIGRFNWLVVSSEHVERTTGTFKQNDIFFNQILIDSCTFSPTSGVKKIRFGKKESNELTLVENADKLLDIIFELNQDIYIKFINSCYWFYTAREVWKISHSFSYIGLVTSIECLMNKADKCQCGSVPTEKSIEKCEICGEPKYKLGKNFKDFLEKYSHDEYSNLTQKEKNHIYNIRSTMIHGEKPFSLDLESMGFLGYQKSFENSIYMKISELVYKALINWISKRN